VGQLIPIPLGETLQDPGRHPTHAYFPEQGMGSVVALLNDGEMIEAAVVGIDGFIGTSLLLGAPSATTRVTWQVAGQALRVPADDFLRIIQQDSIAPLLGYVQELCDQTAQVAACNRRHVIRERAARWLLSVSDRIEGDRFELTHEFLATMLGAGRPKVTLAARQLQGEQLIRYRRGVVTITDRAGLGRAACECYETLAAIFPGR
jgi:CRP-like cAMP-binding protein